MSPLKDFAERARAPFRQRIENLATRVLEGQGNQLEKLMILQGRALALANWERAPAANVRDCEFKVFSQFGEDGIIQYLIRETGITPAERTFIEFGVQDYSESNTRFLLMNDYWRGLILDGSAEYMAHVRRQDYFWRSNLLAIDAWIDRDNINTLIAGNGFSGDIGLLSVDIDGNDYWVWERVDVVRPVIVAAEYNSGFGSEHAVSVPYDREFERTKAHYSNLFWGVSIAALEFLGQKKGYTLVGSNTAGNNVFFVRNDRLNRLKAITAADAYVDAIFRESRDEEGNLTFLSGRERNEKIADLPVTDVRSGSTTTLRALNGVGGAAP